MSDVFEHGYALIVGVDENQIPRLALPAVAKDVQAVYDVLVHPQRCAYNPENVRLLKGGESTRDNILDGLYWLQDKVGGDAEATAVIYYSGHGMVDNNTSQYFLIPYNISDLSRIRRFALQAEDLTAEISGIRAKRLLAILDCCHSAGMDVKDVDLAAIDNAPHIEPAPFPLELPDTKNIPPFTAELGAKNVSDLLDGEGRAVLNSSTGAQSSYVRNDGSMSLFTYHLIEALTGHAPHPDDATVVYVTDVMSWVTHQVKKSARDQGRDQTPVMKTSGVFPIAQLIGGQGVAKGLGQLPPDPLEPLPPAGQTTTFNQQGQTVTGPQVNVGGDAQIGQIGNNQNVNVAERGVYATGSVAGSIVTGDGNVLGDQVQGDKVAGDKVGGDKISVGNISGSQGVAIGRGASASVQIQQGPTMNELTPLFAPLLVQAAQVNPTAVGQLQTLKAEVAKGEEADDNKMADLIADIAEAAPGVVSGLVNLFTNSVVANIAGGATQFILRRLTR